MKYIKWLVLGLMVASCSRGDEIRISGKVEHGAGLMIYLDEQGLTSRRSVDSARIKRDLSYELTDRVEVPTFYNLHLGDENIIPLLVLPGSKVTVNTDHIGFSRNYSIEGSEESVHIRDLNRQMGITRKKLDSLTLAFEMYQNIPEEVMAIQEAYAEIYEAQRRYNIKFILEHRNSMAAIYALYQRFDDDEFLLNTYRDVQLLKITGQALDTIWPESEYVQSLVRDAANLESDLQNRNIRSLMDASTSNHPEIRLPSPDGDTTALSSLNGKVILLSFWASWHEESVRLNREFKKLHERYHEQGFEIYQVSFDSDLERWKRSIQYDELPWINVSELSYPKSSVAGVYNVSELPSFYLIDRNGEIAGRDYELMALDRKIYELVNENQ